MRKIVIGLLSLGMIGCVEMLRSVGTDGPVSEEPKPEIRRITIEPTGSGTSCRVTYPPDPEMRDMRWVTGSDEKACRALADKALALFEANGWLCDAAEPSDATTSDRSLVWRCART
jgi:hypothetical protein